MKKILAFILFCIMDSSIFAQSFAPQTEVTIDPDSRLPDRIAPFDQPFVLNFPVDSIYSKEYIKLVTLYHVKRCYRYNITLTIDSLANEKHKSGEVHAFDSLYQHKYLISVKVVYLKGKTLAELKTTLSKTGASKALNMTQKMWKENKVPAWNFIAPTAPDGVVKKTPIFVLKYLKTKKETDVLKLSVSPLEYRENYLISVQYKAAPKWIDKLIEATDFMNEGCTATAKKAYNEGLLKELKAFNKDAEQKLPYLNYDDQTILYDDYLAYNNSKLKPAYKKLNFLYESSPELITKYTALVNDLKKGKYCNDLLKCDCHNQNISDESGIMAGDMLAVCCNSTKLAPAALQLIASNKISLSEYLGASDTASLRKIKGLDTLQKNLDKTILQLGALRSLFSKSTLSKDLSEAKRDSTIHLIDELISSLAENSKRAKDQKKEIILLINKVVDKGIKVAVEGQDSIPKIFPFQKFNNIESLNSDLKTASGNYIIPDFGIAFMKSYSNNPVNGNAINTNGNFMVHPYYGLNFSFVPINKNVRLKDVRYRPLLHRVSATVGLTLLSLSKTRTDVSDLLTNTSLITGINIRLNKWLRFGAGTVWYLHDDINPLLPQTLALMPYVSASIDLDVVNTASNFWQLIK
jgi:hypothetical protein